MIPRACNVWPVCCVHKQFQLACLFFFFPSAYSLPADGLSKYVFFPIDSESGRSAGEVLHCTTQRPGQWGGRWLLIELFVCSRSFDGCFVNRNADDVERKRKRMAIMIGVIAAGNPFCLHFRLVTS